MAPETSVGSVSVEGCFPVRVSSHHMKAYSISYFVHVLWCLHTEARGRAFSLRGLGLSLVSRLSDLSGRSAAAMARETIVGLVAVEGCF